MTDDEATARDDLGGPAEGVPQASGAAEASGAADPRDNPFDAWLAEAPSRPEGGACPWCSEPLGPSTPAACPSCGAQLVGGEAREIPGVTVVDPMTVARRPRGRKPSGSLGVMAWLAGDSDLVAAASAPPSSPPPDAPDPDRSGTGRMGTGEASGSAAGLPPGVPAAALGPPSRDAVAPPDRRLRLEMALLGVEPPSAAEEPEADAPSSAVEVPGPEPPDGSSPPAPPSEAD